MKMFELLTREKDIRSFKAGETIFSANQPGKEMFAVIEGKVDIVIKKEVVETVEEQGIFGEMALVDDKPRAAGAVAKTDCRIAVISRSRFVFLVQQTPNFALDVMSVMAERLRHQMEPCD